jgi:hypothetical protein
VAEKFWLEPSFDLSFRIEEKEINKKEEKGFFPQHSFVKIDESIKDSSGIIRARIRYHQHIELIRRTKKEEHRQMDFESNQPLFY